MTNKKAIIAIAAVLVAVLLGAAALYRSLLQREFAAPALPEAQSVSQQTSASSMPEEPEAPASSTPEAPEAPEEQETQSVAAPDFTMLDAEGNSVAFSDYLGTPIVLNFWASWCGPCKNEMPGFNSAAAELAGKVSFMMVNLTDGGRETVEGASRFIEEQGYTFPVFFDTLSEGAIAYSVRSIPVTYFIDAEGMVLAYFAGSMDEATLRQGIEMILEQ